MKRLDIKLIAAALSFTAIPVAAADFDGTKPLICSAIEANDCAAGFGCLKGLAEDVNAPQFLRLDFAGKTISARGRTSKMPTPSHANGLMTIQGVESDRSYSFTVSEATGKLVAAIAGDEEGFVIFGACTPL